MDPEVLPFARHLRERRLPAGGYGQILSAGVGNQSAQRGICQFSDREAVYLIFLNFYF
jgi:hypothetical protein